MQNYNFDVRNGPIKIEWFVGAKTNVCYNAVDRHVENGKGDQVAFYWEGNDVDEEKVWTYSQLKTEVIALIPQLVKNKKKKKMHCFSLVRSNLSLGMIIFRCASLPTYSSLWVSPKETRWPCTCP